MRGNSRYPSRWPALLWLVVWCGGLNAQTYRVEAQKTITIDVAGGTAAYTLDSTYAEATVENGVVTVSGKIAGTTHVIVVTPSGTQAFEILVINPTQKIKTGPAEAFNLALGVESGYSESRYTSMPTQVQNTLDFSRRQDDTNIHMHVVANRQLGPLSIDQSRTALSSASYEISTSRRDITILDQYLDDSPLGIAGSIVRGVHVTQDGWRLHAGYTSVASFEGMFLPTRPEGVIEAGYRRPLAEHSSLTAALYHFSVPSVDTVGHSGTAGVLTYTYSTGENFRFSADLGVSRGIAASARLEYHGDRDTVRGSIRYAPSMFASLGANNIKGFHSDLSWTRKIIGDLSSDLTFYNNRLALPGLEQTTMTAGAKLQYRLGGHWTIFGGATGSTYDSETPRRPTVRNLSAPAGLGFNSRHFGAQGQYQFSQVSKQESGAQQFRASVRAGAGPLSVSAFAERQTQAPTLSFVLDQSRGLRQALDLLGLQASTLEQVDQLLRDSAYLFAAGYLQGASVNLAPVRSQVGGTAVWSGRGRHQPQVSYNFLYNDNHDLMGSSLSSLHSIVYMQRLGAEHFSVSYSLAGMKAPGVASLYLPVLSIAWRHQLSSVPPLIFPERHGSISGVVFRDDNAKGAYESGMPLMADVQVVLDGTRHVKTGVDGSFRFTRVPVGKHRVVVSYRSDRPTYFSTQSDVDVTENGTVNFGIAFSLSGMMGRIVNDAGEGVAGVSLAIRSRDHRWTATSDGNGSFLLRQVPEGEYQVEIDEDSIPPGYLTSDLEAQTVTVGVTAPGQVAFSVRALRSIGGRVVRFDATPGQTLPVAGKTVTLKGTARTSTTDALGRYLFRELAAGSYTVAVADGAREVTSVVTLPAAPLTITDVDLQLGGVPPAAPAAAAPIPAAPPRKEPPAEPNPPQPALPAAAQSRPAPAAAELPEAAAELSLPNRQVAEASAKLHESVGRQKLDAGQYQEAIRELSEAIRLAPDYAPAYNARGFAWYKLNKLSNALADLDRAIALNPNYMNAYRNRAVVRRAAGDLVGAEADRRLERMRAKKPN